jgi:hypothetical protein
MAYEAEAVVGRQAVIQPYFPYINVKATASLIVFAPQPGDELGDAPPSYPILPTHPLVRQRISVVLVDLFCVVLSCLFYRNDCRCGDFFVFRRRRRSLGRLIRCSVSQWAQ